MKKILFSLESLQNEKMKYHGGGKYGLNIIKLLSKNQILLKNITIFFDSKKIITDELREILDNEAIYKMDRKDYRTDEKIYEEINKNYHYIFTPIREKFFLSSKIKIKKICPIHDVRFYEISPTFDSIKLEEKKIKKIKRICWILFKKLFLELFKKKEMPSKEDYIITVSEYSKYSILLTYPYLNKENIKVLNPLLEKNTKISNSLEKIKDFEKNYFLLISANRWEKNALKVIENFDSLVNDFKNIDKKMVVVGIKNNYIKLKNPEMFIFIDYVPTEELEYLYKKSYCFVYPTLNEGFGYPPLEAMKYGIPVIASAVTSVTEVCKNNVEYMNPYSDYEIKNKILYLIDNKQRYKELEEKSKKYFLEIEFYQKTLSKMYFDYFSELVNL